MVISKLTWTARAARKWRKMPLVAAVMCVALIGGLTIWWQMGQVAEAAILDPHPGLVGWWRFDEGAGDVAEDSSEYGNDGAVYGATWVEGKYGKHGEALSFDGADDYVDCGDDASLDITDEITVACWFKSDFSETHTFLLSRIGRDGWWLWGDNNGLIWLRIRDDDGNYCDLLSSAGATAADTWHHVAGVFSGPSDIQKIYVDGVEVATKTPTVSSIGIDSRLRIGRNLWWAIHSRGVIDEVRIYNQALSAGEIESLFQKGPDYARALARVPKGTTEFIVTLSWQGKGSINITVESPSENYTEDMVPVYQRTSYSSDSGDMLNIKRLTVSVTALSSDENWYIILEFGDVEDYRITVEVQK